MNRVGKAMIEKAKGVPFHQFMLDTYPDEVRAEGHEYARSREDKRLVLSRKGYYFNGEKDNDDGIGYLRKYHGLSFQDAVCELCDYADGTAITASASIKSRCFTPSDPCSAKETSAANTDRPFALPSISEEGTRKLIAYLKQRGIPYDTVMAMRKEGIVFPTIQSGYTNIVFKSATYDYAEIHGTDPKYRFVGKVPGSITGGYWLLARQYPKRIFICEAAIDAISLMLLLKQNKSLQPDDAFVSIGGCGAKSSVDHIKYLYCNNTEIIIAFDNDAAGDAAAQQYPKLKRIVPKLKDWNEDLVQKVWLNESTYHWRWL